MLEHGGCLFDVAGGILLDAQLGHLMDQLGVEETLLARLRLIGARLKGLDALDVHRFVVDSGGAKGDRGNA
jgi:hypothetical protein